jgi:hypothetical protein
MPKPERKGASELRAMSFLPSKNWSGRDSDEEILAVAVRAQQDRFLLPLSPVHPDHRHKCLGTSFNGPHANGSTMTAKLNT